MKIQVNFGGLLLLLFITLKLCGVITWSWLWVLSPMWIPALIALGIIFIFILVKGLSS